MKRTTRLRGTRTPALLGGLVLLAFTTSSVAAADDGPGPFAVTVTAAATAQNARIGALFPANRASRLAGAHFCTASVVHGPYRNLIVSAAHCLDGSGDGSGDLVFVPGYRDGRAPYGVWKVRRRFLPDGWAKGKNEDSDVAFAVLAPQHGKGIEDVVGANRFTPGTATGATAVTITGYPDSRETPITCTNKPTAHSPTQQRIECPRFTGGTSGSPWINGDGQVVGVLGGHEKGGATPDVSYSVVLGAEAAELYRDAAPDP